MKKKHKQNKSVRNGGMGMEEVRAQVQRCGDKGVY